MNKSKTLICLSVFLLLANCSFAKPKKRSRPIQQKKFRLEKAKANLPGANLAPVDPQPEEDVLPTEPSAPPEDSKPRKPKKKDNIGKPKPAPKTDTQKPGQSNENIAPNQQNHKYPQIRPKPKQIKPPVEEPKPPQIKPKPSVEKPKPKPEVEKPRPPRPSHPNRFPRHLRDSRSYHPPPWNHHYHRRPPRRYRGSSYFYPHFPRYYYDSWIILEQNTIYATQQLPEQMRIRIACGNYVEFELEDNPDTAYQWMASYDAWYSRIDIIQPPKDSKRLPQFLSSKVGKATIQIEALNPGTTMVELFYTRPWEFERGDNPAKRIQLYLEITPE